MKFGISISNDKKQIRKGVLIFNSGKKIYLKEEELNEFNNYLELIKRFNNLK